MANAISNFVNWIANWAKQVVLDPIVDLWALAAKGVNKGLDLVTWDNLSQYTNPKISKAAEWIKAQAESPVDPTSTSYAVWEGLVHWVDNAAMALWLVQLAKQVWKQWLKQLPKLLGKYQDAKDKKAQLQAAQEIRDYIQKQAKSPTAVTSDVPAYQQRAYANEWNANNDIKMDTFKDVWGNQSVFPKRNLTDQFRQVDNTYTNPVSKDMAKNNIIKERWEFPATIKNDLNKPLSKTDARNMDIPYGGSNMQEVKNVQKTVNDIAKMSNKDFKKFMQNNESAAMAWYEPSWWDYRLEDTWHSWDLWKTKDAVIKNILNHHSLEQEWTLTNTMQSTIRNNAIKNNKNYRKWYNKSKRYDRVNLTPQERASAIQAEKNTNAALKAGWDPQTEPFDLYF